MSPNQIIFKDYPDFKPNLTPRDIFNLGSFGGTYWRPIKSMFFKKIIEKRHLKYPKSWWKGINDKKMVTPWDKYDAKINKYGVYCGSTLEQWESSGWIVKSHPYGWVEWYCDFYNGKRGDDDERQIKRWIRTAGPNSRFRRRLIGMIKDKKSTYDDYSISPKIRQTLQHWGYVLTKQDLK